MDLIPFEYVEKKKESNVFNYNNVSISEFNKRSRTNEKYNLKLNLEPLKSEKQGRTSTNRGFQSEVLARPEDNEFADSSRGPRSKMILRRQKKGAELKLLPINRTTIVPVGERQHSSRNQVPEGFQSRKEEKISHIEPKINQPFHNEPGSAPRKVILQRVKKQQQNMDLQSILRMQGVDLAHWTAGEDSGLMPLEPFDDSEQEQRTPQDQLHEVMRGTKQGVRGKAVNFNQVPVQFHSCLITFYDPKTEFYTLLFDEHPSQVKTIHKIWVIFDVEDPVNQAKRLNSAISRRNEAINQITYIHQVEKMPIDGLSRISKSQQNRIVNFIGKNFSGNLLTKSMNQLKYEQSKVMNKMIFNKHIEVLGPKLTLPKVKEPFNVEKREVSNIGKMFGMKRKQFLKNHRDFSFKCLYITSEVLETLVSIKSLCDHVSQFENIWLIEIKKSQKPEDFKQIQRTAYMNCKNNICNIWIDDIIKAIKVNLTKVGKGWQNMHETNTETYEFSKLKKFLTIVRFMMQEAISKLSSRCVNTFLKFIINLIPKNIMVNSINDIEQIFIEDEEPEFPIFGLEVVSRFEDVEVKSPQGFTSIRTDYFFEFDTNPNDIPEIILTTFENGIKVLSEVNQVEMILMKDLYKTVNETKIKAVTFNSLEPPRGLTEEQILAGGHLDENIKIWEHYLIIKEKINDSIEPINQWLNKLQFQKNEIGVQPDEQIQSHYSKLMSEINSQIPYSDANPKTPQSDLEFELDEIKRDVVEMEDIIQNIQKNIPDEIHIGIVKVSCKKVKTNIIEKRVKIKDRLTYIIYLIIKFFIEEIKKEKLKIIDRMHASIGNIRELSELRKQLDDISIYQNSINKKITETYSMQTQLENMLYPFSKEDMLEKWDLMLQKKQIQDQKERKESEMEARKKQFIEILQNEQLEFETEIKGVEDNIEKLFILQDERKYKDQNDYMIELDRQLNSFNNKMIDLNEQEQLFGMTMTNYKIKEMFRKFEVYKHFWSTVKSWRTNQEQWLNCEWREFNGVQVDSEVIKYKLNLQKAKAVFSKNNETMKLSDQIDTLLAQIEDFCSQLPLAVNLSNEGMHERHWDILSMKIHIKINPMADKSFCFRKLLELKLENHQDLIEEVCNRAAKEQTLSRDLDGMVKKWDELVFTFYSTPKSDMILISNFEEVISVSDEHLGMTANLIVSPYKSYQEAQLIEWKDSLDLVSEVLERWMKLQTTYMQLQPIFNASDIKKSLPQFAKMFKQVDQRYRNQIINCKKVGNVITQCGNKDFRNLVVEDQVILDKVAKNLENYLIMKRSKFSRFQFLSEDEFLKILSNSKVPSILNTQIKKIFEAVHTLTFNDHDNSITHINSNSGEIVKLADRIIYNEAIEIWCSNIEAEILKTVKILMDACIGDKLKKTNKIKWMTNNHISQLILIATQIEFTRLTEQSILEKDLPVMFENCEKSIEGLIKLIRGEMKEQVNAQMRKIISPMVVQEVHQRDIIAGLQQHKVTNVLEFEWISKLRFQIQMDKEIPFIMVSCVQTEQPQGQEQIGNSDRLVITPLSEKCQMTLMGAFRLHCAGASFGPAGTGKTETVKDISKNVARLCKVFNCGPEIEYKMMGVFFKGIISCGAWACFDEFNRINVEVLSVIAQQLQTSLHYKVQVERNTIERNKKMNRNDNMFNLKNDPLFTFMDKDITFKPSFNVFITMNPDQHGRQQLPDNLIVLFRPCAMYIPDYKLISEIQLQSQGFFKSKQLATRIIDTFKLCSEQLSRQKHQDYSMRAVRGTIKASSKFRTLNPKMDENTIIQNAMRDINISKFVDLDKDMFENILKDLFTDVQVLDSRDQLLRAAISKTMEAQGLDNNDLILNKIGEIFENSQIRTGIMLIGKSGVGKTKTFESFKNSMNFLVKEQRITDFENSIQKPIKSQVMNPKSILNEQVYGIYNDFTKEYQRGIVPYVFNLCIDSHDHNYHMVVFDSPIDSMWVETLNSVLDENKKLCLPNSEIVDLTPEMNIVFETDNLHQTNLSTISRCGMIQIGETFLNCQSQQDFLIKKLPTTLSDSKFYPRLKQMQDQFMEDCLEYVMKNCHHILKPSKCNQLQSFFNQVNSLVYKTHPNEQDEVDKQEIKRCVESTELIFVFSLIWALGGNLNQEGRNSFNTYIGDRIHLFNTKQPNEKQLPPKDDSRTQFDVCINFLRLQFVPWIEITPNTTTKSKYIEDIIIPNPDSYRYYQITEKICSAHYNIITQGPTGTGKSINSSQLINNLAPETQYSVNMQFNARTNVEQINDLLEPVLHRRKKGVYGPDNNCKALVFIDDLNIVRKDVHGAQPPLELIRQLIDYGQQQDPINFEHKKIEDLFFLSAMGLPGGGRTEISERVMKNWTLLGYTLISDTNVFKIFSNIMDDLLLAQPTFVTKNVDILVESTLNTFNLIIQHFLPIPSKSHYIFNMRDILKVFQGFMISDTTTMKNKFQMVRLWVHEMNRVFRDKLIDSEDTMAMDSILRQACQSFVENEFKTAEVEDPREEIIKMDVNADPEAAARRRSSIRNIDRDKLDEMIASNKPKDEEMDVDIDEEDGKTKVADIVTNDQVRELNTSGILFSCIDGSNDNERKRQIEPQDVEELKNTLNEFLEEFNSEPQNQMSMVLFESAVMHVNRVVRVLNFSKGNMLLIGPSGSGKAACTRLACFIMSSNFVSTNMAADQTIGETWKNTVKEPILFAGLNKKSASFLLSDSHLDDNKMLEDVSQLINSQEIPNLYNPEELEKITESTLNELNQIGLEQTSSTILNLWIKTLKKNLHIFVSLSPAHLDYKNNLRNFPSIVNCTTADFQFEWPLEALVSVADRKIDDAEIGEQREGLMKSLALIHKNVTEVSVKFTESTKIPIFISPLSYVQMLNTQNNQIEYKKNQFQDTISRYEQGNMLIGLAQTQVDELKSQITEEEPKLLSLETFLDENKENLTKSIEETTAKKEQIAGLAAEQNEKLEALKKLSDQINAEKLETEKEKEQAIKLSERLTNKDLTELNNYTSPPEAVSQCMKAIMLLFDEEKEVKNKDELSNWFFGCKTKLLKNVSDFKEKLKRRLQNEEITDKQIKKLEPIQDENKFETNYQENISAACYKLAVWIKSIRLIYQTNIRLQPILEKLNGNKKKLEGDQNQMKKLKSDMKELEDKVNEQKAEFDESNTRKEEILYNLEFNKLKLVRAKRLIAGLHDEQERWKQEIKKLNQGKIKAIGNIVITACTLEQSGPFDYSFRSDLMKHWKTTLLAETIPMDENKCSIADTLGNRSEMNLWKQQQRLPDDSLSIENAIIIQNTKKYPLCIDPQQTASNFITKLCMDKDKNLFKIMSPGEDKMIQELEMAIKYGKMILLENIGENIPFEFESVLSPQIKTRGKNIKIIKFNDKEIEQNDNFMLQMTTSNPFPKFSPAIFLRTSVLNFVVTQQGLLDQMQAMVVSAERFELESELNNLIEINAANEKSMRQLEDDILDQLKSNSKNILDDEEIITKLDNTKEESSRIKRYQEESETREKSIKLERNKYLDIAQKLTLLFFVLMDFSRVNFMYQFSLNWFKTKFEQALEKCAIEETQEQRVKDLWIIFLQIIYEEVSRSLFEHDKILFSFTVSVRLQLFYNKLENEHFLYLIQGSTEDNSQKNLVPPDWVDAITWTQMVKGVNGLKKLSGFLTFKEYFIADSHKFRAIYESNEPNKVPLPGEWHQSLNQFQKMLVYKIIRPDVLKWFIKDYIATVIGPQQNSPPVLDLFKIWETSDRTRPIIYLVLPGSDVLNDTRKLCDRITGQDLLNISLGAGQEVLAKEQFNKAKADGNWVLQQNTHVFESWMPQLIKLIESLKQPGVSEHFRLFLSTNVSANFPVRILQDGIKITVESNADLKNMMLANLLNIDDDEISLCTKPHEFKRFIFSLTLFHALLVERVRYGPIGWVNPYNFPKEDFTVSFSQIRNILNEQSSIDYNVMQTIIAKINYGGRVTDQADERVLTTFVKEFINDKVAYGNEYSFIGEKGKYMLPKFPRNANIDTYKEQITENYRDFTIDLLGLHPNADIAVNINIVDKICSNLYTLFGTDKLIETRSSDTDFFLDKSSQIKTKIPEKFSMESLRNAFPLLYEESFNSVLTQEAEKFNLLLDLIEEDLDIFIKSQKGLQVMTSEMESMAQRIQANEVPRRWGEDAGVGFTSIKFLNDWLNDLQSRVEFLKSWEANGTPTLFWISSFFFPQSFIAAVKQNYSRKQQIEFNQVNLEFEFLDSQGSSFLTDKPEDGCQIHGLFIEGAKFDEINKTLVESAPRELQSKFPMIWVRPTKEELPVSKLIQSCPVYKTVLRSGDLSSTGHSTNQVMELRVPSSVNKDKWIKAGVAAMLSLKQD